MLLGVSSPVGGSTPSDAQHLLRHYTVSGMDVINIASETIQQGHSLRIYSDVVFWVKQVVSVLM